MSVGPRSALVTLSVVALAGFAGCGGDDNNDTAATSTPAATPVTEAAPAAKATPATTPADAGALEVKATEFAFDPADLTAKAGKVKITLQNTGSAPHELVVLKTNEAADKLKVTGGRVSEDASVGEVPEIAAGEKKSATLDLKPGTYVYVCNIPGHYAGGMHGTLTVQ